MKRLYLLFITLILAFGLLACDPSDGGEDQVSLDIPTNLVIEGSTLKWDKVENAVGYIVFINDEEVATVKTNSYKFTPGDNKTLVFAVVAQGKKGVNDSKKSATVAFVVDASGEIQKIKNYMTENDVNLPEVFADEVVRKGMTGDEFIALIETIGELFDKIDDAETPLEGNEHLQTLLSLLANQEAFISGLAVSSKVIIDKQLVVLEEVLQMLKDEKELTGDSHLDLMIELYENQKVSLNHLKDSLSEKLDNIVTSLMFNLNYFADLHSKFMVNLIPNLLNLMDNEEIEINNTEIIVVKDEMVQLFLENLPSESDMKLMLEVVFIGLEGMNRDQAEFINNSKNKIAKQLLLNTEALLKLIDTVDQEFLDTVAGFEELATGSQRDVEAFILIAKYFQRYLDDNEELFTRMNSVFSEEDKVIILNSYLKNFANALIAAGVSVDLDNELTNILTDFEKFNFFNKMFKASLRQFVDTDGELLRLIVESSSYDSMFVDTGGFNFEEIYENTYLGVTYDSYEEFSAAQEETSFKLAKELLNYYAPTFGLLTNTDLTNIIDLVYKGIPVSELAWNLELSEEDAQALVDLVKDHVVSTIVDLKTLADRFVEFAIETELVDGVKATDELINLHSEENEEYVIVIFITSKINEFATAENVRLFKSIATSFFELLEEDLVLGLTDLEKSEVTEMKTAIVDAIDEIVELSGVIKDYNVETLTQAQKDKIEEFVNLLGEFFNSFDDEE